MTEKRHYEVALSFAGEQRSYVESVGANLKELGISVFYDEFEKVRLWGKNLLEEFHEVFTENANRTVMFISKDYVEKAWPEHERRSILSRAIKEKSEYILPVRFDDTPVPGLPDTIRFERAEDHTPKSLAEFIVAKIRNLDRGSDELYKSLPETSSETGKDSFQENERQSKSHGKDQASHRCSDFKDVKITHIIEKEITEPRNDGTPGSALYTVPFALNTRPPGDWVTLFLKNWRHPAQYTMMHLPQNASISGATLILRRTTLDDVNRYHRDTLVWAIDETNRQFREILKHIEKKRVRLQTERDKHRKHVSDVAKRIKFD